LTPVLANFCHDYENHDQESLGRTYTDGVVRAPAAQRGSPVNALVAGLRTTYSWRKITRLMSGTALKIPPGTPGRVRHIAVGNDGAMCVALEAVDRGV